MEVSEKTEALIVGVGAACEAGSLYIAQSGFPNELKLVLAPIFGLGGILIHAFWYGYVNKEKKPTA